ncbi:MAG: hypothetical protein ACOX81_01285 [Candidatus Heteroscillospira sp.]
MGIKVRNRFLGEGIVENCCGDKIYLRLGEKSVTVGFPDAFLNSYIIEDEAAKAYVESLASQRREQEQQRFSAARVKTQEEQRSRAELSANVAFKCNWCDGGSDCGHIGYQGVCSDEAIRYNVNRAKRRWCTNSVCREYIEGKADRDELSRVFKDGFVCYESTMLLDWRAYAGADQTDERAGRRRGMKEARTNSLAVLTTRRPHTSEEQRLIFAVFLIAENFEGNERDEGYVSAHGDYRIELTSAEAEKLRYWDYHANANSADKCFWGTGLFRYLGDTECAQILRDIADMRRYTPGEAQARDFLERYCALRNLNPAELPPKVGALTKL